MEKKGLISNKMVKTIIEFGIIIAVAYLLAKGISTFVFEKYYTPTGSMEETILTTDKVLLNHLSYVFSNPKRGDIVVFNNPDNPEEELMKRVIGLPGETISFADGRVYIDGTLLEEEYVHGKETWDKGTSEFVIPEGCYFMMGDNRTSSMDARGWDNPFVKKSEIIGRIFMRYSPSIKFF